MSATALLGQFSERSEAGKVDALGYDEERGVVEFLVRSDGRSDVDGDGASVRDADELAGVLDGIIAEAKDGARDGGEVSAAVVIHPSRVSPAKMRMLGRGKAHLASQGVGQYQLSGPFKLGQFSRTLARLERCFSPSSST